MMHESMERRITRLIELHKKKLQLNDELSQVTGEMGVVSDLLAEEFGAAGYQSIARDDFTVYKAVELHVSAKAERRGELVAMARQLGLEDMLTVQPQRLKSYVRELRDSDELTDEMEALLNVHEAIKVRVRKR